MPCEPAEYHPYAACLMFKGCHNSATVRANLAPLAAAIARAEAAAAERDAAMFRRVMAIGKLPVRCSTGYYYSDGVIHPTPEAAIAAQGPDLYTTPVWWDKP